MSAIDTILKTVAENQKDAFLELFQTIEKHIPKGFEPCIAYGMLGFVVPLSIYPKGYHCKAQEPLPFISIAARKNFITFSHMGVYANPELYQWVTTHFPKYSVYKLDIGKSCIRFKKWNEIPLDFIADLVKKMSAQQWIALYETLYLKDQ